MTSDLTRSTNDGLEPMPLTSICVVADKHKTPKGFTALRINGYSRSYGREANDHKSKSRPRGQIQCPYPRNIIKASDDSSDADLWRESSFSIFSRPVRYLAICRDIPETAIKGAPVSVITDLTVIKDSDPVPHGFVPLDYTVDSKERSLRKRLLCVRSQHKDRVTDAIGEIQILNKTKKTPRGFSSAGEVDGCMIVFRVVIIPEMYGMPHSVSDQNLAGNRLSAPNTMYPGLSASGSTPANLDQARVNAFTIKGAVPRKVGALEGVPFVLHPSLNPNSRCAMFYITMPEIGVSIGFMVLACWSTSCFPINRYWSRRR